MMYEDVVADFAQRTRANLEAIRQQRITPGSSQVFETTQLVNSMLGLLVFPQQRYIDRIPEAPLSELVAAGWPIPQVVGNHPQAEDLRQLVRLLRNAIAHFNIEFIPGADNQIEALTVWNTTPRPPHKVTWKARLTIADLDGITDRFIELLQDGSTFR